MIARYSSTDLWTFLRAIDDALEKPAEIVIVGGAAAALCYGATRETSDIDTFNGVEEALTRAVAIATQRTGLSIPVRHSGVCEQPYNIEDRMLESDEPLSKLRIIVPDRYDLALMKAVRGQDNDQEVIGQMHAVKPFDLEELLTRAEEEMSSILHPAFLALNLRAIAEKLFGEEGLRACDRHFKGAAWTRV